MAGRLGDGRNAEWSLSTYSIVAARVSAAGAVLDTGGIVLDPAVDNSARTAIAFDGTNYLVVWSTPWSHVASGGPIRGKRISPAGLVLDDAGFDVTTTFADHWWPAMAFDGTNYLVVWRQNTDIYGTRVSPSGTVLNPGGIPICKAADNQDMPAVAWGGSNYLVTWHDHRSGTSLDIYGARVTSAGAVLDPNGILISAAAGDQIQPAVSSDGTSFLVAWGDGRAGNKDIYASRVSSAGAVLDAAGIGITPGLAGDQIAPRLGFDGQNHVVVWEDARLANPDVYAARITPAGAVLDPNGFPISAGSGTTPARQPAVTCAAGSCFVAWADKRLDGVFRVYGARSIGTTIVPPQGFLVAIGGNLELNTSVASDGTDYLVVWEDYRNDRVGDIYGVRVSGAGVVLDSPAIPISTAPNDQLTPQVAWMAPHYLVVWEDRRSGAGDIYGARVSPAGTVLDPNGIPIDTGAEERILPALAADGANWLVVWSKGSTPTSAFGARVNGSGAVLDPGGIQISPTYAYHLRLAFDGTRYLIIWRTDVPSGVGGTRVAPDGSVLDAPNSLVPPSTVSDLDVAFDGQSFLVVHQRSNGIYGTRMTGAGTLLDATPFPISTTSTTYAPQVPAVACDGSSCLVVWKDHRNQQWDVYGSFVRGGTVLNPSGIPISTVTSTDAYVIPAVARDANGHALVTYERWGLYSPYGGQRAHARLVLGAACSVAAECASGFCVDHVCCNTACSNGANPCFACSAARGASVNGTCSALTGVPCNDGNGCTQTDVCQAGACVGSNPVVCAPADACHVAGTCNSTMGTCSTPAAPNGTPCSDGNACTQSDTCQSGACGGGSPVACPAPTQCTTVSACDPTTGTCTVSNKPDGTACNDGDACTKGDSCQAGVCVGGSPITCTALDACHVAGTCNPATGACSNPTKADGAPCSDGNACTQSDTCQSGACGGGSPVACPAPTQCTTVSACDPTTGTCTVSNKPDGTACNDGDACTKGDSCQAGVCVGGSPVVCTALDQCHAAGTCNPATGACSNPAKADGASCNDGDACTQSDSCQSGACVGGNPVTCPGATPCTTGSTCDPATGACKAINKPDGTSCNDGDACTLTDTCQAGVCVGGNSVQCIAVGPCRLAGTCNPATGVCSTPSAPDGTPCTDSNACTLTDTCKAGVCVGDDPVVCPAPTACTTVTACNPATGACTVSNKTDGTACNDGDACTKGDSCQSGACVGGNPVVCPPADECHEQGTCDPGTGQCSSPAKPDGTACSTGTCASGVCTGSSSSSSGGGGGGGGGGSASSSGGSSSGGGASSSSSGGGGASSSSSSSGSSTGSGGAPSSSSSSGSSTGGGSGSASSSSGEPASSGGCGCRTAGDDGTSGAPVLLLAALAFTRRRTRRAA